MRIRLLITVTLICSPAHWLGLVAQVRAEPVAEVEVQLIELNPPWNQDVAEYSGMTWCDNKLILLPQYPERLNDEDEVRLPYLEKEQIERYLKSDRPQTLVPKTLLLKEKDLRNQVTLFEGFEAIACQHGQLWISSEVINATQGYETLVARGKVNWKTQSIELDETSFQLIPSQSRMINIGDEAIALFNERLITLHEVNDERRVPRPTAKLIDPITQEIEQRPLPSIPFRITDATSVDSNNRFWIMNYKYSGDDFSREAPDSIADRYGLGSSHQKYYNLERLVELQIDENNISLVNRPPIQLKMNDVEGRNWEGLVRLDQRGFLVITDKHPKTLFGFVPLEN